MPPEPLPWDRKDFFKERKHHSNTHHNDRSSDSLLGGAGGSGGGPLTRWRDYSSSSHHGREFPRWGSVDLRRPPGHGKQGGWYPFTEEPGHGYASSRSGDKMLEDESNRLSVSRGDGKYVRNIRESNKGSFSRDWRGHSSETSNGSSNTTGRLHDINNGQRSVDDMLTYSSHPQSDFINTWDHLQLKDQHDKMGGANGPGTGQRCERENSLDWKPLKWTRSGSLSSRGSGFSHSSSSKSLGGIDSNEGKAELQVKNATLVHSPSGDAATYASCAAPSEETTSRKKPRLGWGEGLAKYEKKKVEGPDVSINKDGVGIFISNAETAHSLSSNLAEKSPRVIGFSDCASPATPSSVACSSSSGVEEKVFGKSANADNDISNLCGSPSIGSQNHLDGFLFNLEKLDSSSIANLGASLIELLHPDDPSFLDSSFVRSTAMNKLQIWKGDISKVLEMTESEIDSLENELKFLKSALGNSCPCPATSSSLSEGGKTNHLNEQGTFSNLVARPAPLQIDSCGDGASDKMPDCNHVLDEVHADVKDEDIDSPGTATSKFVEPISLVKEVSPPDMVKYEEFSGDLDAIQSANDENKCSVSGSLGEEMTDVYPDGNGDMLTENINDALVSGDFSLCAEGEDRLCDIILSSNRESAKRASEVFNKLLPTDQCNIDFPKVTTVLRCQNDSLIKEKFVKRKQFLRFKERVLTLKFKAFQHLWKEDMRLLSIRKYRVKSQKKCELSLRATNSGYQKHRSSIRSRFSSPATGNLSLVPTTEIINFTSKLLSDSHIKVYRDSLKMPALILDNKEKMASRFISSNGLVEDPCAVEKERAMINPWSLEETEIFMNKLVTFGKDFRKISSFLDYKTTADCVEFYYKNHKSDCFEKIKKKADFGKQGKASSNTYLVTSGKKWDRQMSAASLDILGEASVMAAAAQADNIQRIYSGRISLGGCSDSKTSLGDGSIIERSGSFDVHGNERETAAADVLAGICGSLSSEAMSSCITSSVDPGEGQREWKHQKKDSVMRRLSTSDVTQNVDDDTCSDESCGEMDPADWTDEEKSIFIQAVSLYGKDFALISQCVRTRSRDQCKVFFSKARKCLGLDFIHTGQGIVGTSVSDDANGGGSDTEDACVLETSSVICYDNVDLKTDEDLLSHVMNSNQDKSNPAGTMNLQTDLNKSEDDNGVGLVVDDDSKDVDPVVTAGRKTKNEPKLASEFESKTLDAGVNKSELVPAQHNLVPLADAGGRRRLSEQSISFPVSVSTREVINPCLSGSNAVVETNGVVNETTSEGFGNSLDRSSLGNSLNSECNKNHNADRRGESEMTQHPSSVENAVDLTVDACSCSDPSKLDCVDKPSVNLLLQENFVGAISSTAQDTAVVHCEKALKHDSLSSTPDLHGSKDDSVHVSVFGDVYHQHLSGHSGLNHVESSHILKGYPLQIPTKKEINGDISCGQLTQVRGISNSDRSSGTPYLSQDCYLQKCKRSISHTSLPELPLLSQNLEPTNDSSRTPSCSLLDIDKPCKNGDVKLFGKILSHPSASQKQNSGSHESEEKGGHHQKQSSKVSNLKFSSTHQGADGGAAVLKFDRNNYIGLENVPVRSYGFWDGNRIQTGFSSLPDSAILLAKYPNAFSDYPATSSKMEQQALQAVVKSNERNLNGVAAHPNREVSSSNGVVDYQIYRSRDGTKIQPFTVDMKQRQDLLYSGFEALSSLQQQGRGVVVGRGGIFGGGSCTAVSDPVAAIKMHYEQFGGQSGSIVREEESWRGKGDIGR